MNIINLMKNIVYVTPFNSFIVEMASRINQYIVVVYRDGHVYDYMRMNTHEEQLNVRRFLRRFAFKKGYSRKRVYYHYI